SPARSERRLGGDFVLSPDGRLLLCKNGTVVRTAADAENDLRFEANVKPFLAATIAPDLGGVLTTADGRLLVSSSPDLKWREALRLPAVGHQMAIDPVKKRLFIAVFDPKALTLRPSERGGGELHEYTADAILPVGPSR